jgi:hypothetical protein
VATNKKGEPCRSPVVNASGLCRVHDPAQADAVAHMQQRGGRRKAESYQAALEAFMERNREKIIAIYREALRANRIAIDQRTAEAIDTQQPDHSIRLPGSRARPRPRLRKAHGAHRVHGQARPGRADGRLAPGDHGL